MDIRCNLLSRKGFDGHPEISNNGLEMDETIPEYTERLLQKVAPIMISWILHCVRDGGNWICCLQEAPGHRHLRRDLLQKVQEGLKDVGASLQSAEQLGRDVPVFSLGGSGRCPSKTPKTHRDTILHSFVIIHI